MEHVYRKLYISPKSVCVRDLKPDREPWSFRDTCEASAPTEAIDTPVRTRGRKPVAVSHIVGVPGDVAVGVKPILRGRSSVDIALKFE